MLALICALPQEAAHLRKVSLVRNGQAKLICCGVGPRNAERVTRQLLADSIPSLVVSTGLAGALSPSLNIGEIVVAREIIDDGSQLRFVCSSPPGLARHTVGDILSTDRMIATISEKKRLADQFAALAVDMESAAIARVCAERKILFAAIRAISDSANQTLPQAVLNFFGQDGNLRLRRVIAEVCQQPSLLPVLWKLQRQTALAGDCLREFLAGWHLE